MVRVKMLQRGEVCIIDDGKTYLFNRAGLCYKEDAGNLVQYSNGMMDLPIISVLSSSGVSKIATFYHDEMKEHDTKLTDKDITMRLLTSGDVIRILNRTGVQDNIKFAQLIIVFKEGIQLNDKLKVLGI